MKLDNKVVLITGAGGGIGQASGAQVCRRGRQSDVG